MAPGGGEENVNITRMGGSAGRLACWRQSNVAANIICCKCSLKRKHRKRKKNKTRIINWHGATSARRGAACAGAPSIIKHGVSRVYASGANDHHICASRRAVLLRCLA